MQQSTFQGFLDALRDQVGDREFSDAGIIRLLSLYRTHDIQPPATLVIEANWRGITIPTTQEQP
jgi:hypothetical protein